MWQQLFEQGSIEVNKLARVSAPKGIIPKKKPLTRSAPAAPRIEFDAPVFVVRTSTQADVSERWAYVTVPAGTAAGFIEEQFLLVDPPEPNAHVHRVTKGETLGAIAESVYAGKITEGNDERLYVQAIYEANKGKNGVYLTDVDLDTIPPIATSTSTRASTTTYSNRFTSSLADDR